MTDLAQGEVAEEGRSTVRLSEGEGRGVAGDLKASTAVLGRDLSLEGPPVLWVRVQSLWRDRGHHQNCARLSMQA